MARAEPPVFRHMQDTDVDCGRACAQMIIASIAQAGMAPATPIVSQRALQLAESQPWDIKGWWFTEPDELRGLLNARTDLSWRTVAKNDPFDMLAEVHLALTGGRPSILTEGASDHWVVVFESVEYPMGWLFRTYNPAPSVSMYELTVGRFPGHSLQDACSTTDFDGDSMTADGEWVLLAGAVAGSTPEKVRQRLGAIDFRVEAVAPPGPTDITQGVVGVRPPSGVPLPVIGPIPQEHACVAVVEGETDRDAEGAVARAIRSAAEATGIGLQSFAEPAVILPGAETALWNVATVTGDTKLAALLQAGDRTLRARLVRNLDNDAQRSDSYVLVGLHTPALSAGLVAVFDARTPVRLLHYLVTTDARLILQLDRFPGEDLWWTRRPTGMEPPLRRHFYPYRREQVSLGVHRITRLYDDVMTLVR